MWTCCLGNMIGLKCLWMNCFLWVGIFGVLWPSHYLILHCCVLYLPVFYENPGRNNFMIAIDSLGGFSRLCVGHRIGSDEWGGCGLPGAICCGWLHRRIRKMGCHPFGGDIRQEIWWGGCLFRDMWAGNVFSLRCGPLS